MEFTFNGISSKDYNIEIKKSNHNSIPSKRMEFIEVQGRTDNLIVDDNSRNMLDVEIEAYIDCRGSDTMTFAAALDAWLNVSGGYKDLIFDDGTKLKAIHVGQIDFGYVVKNFNEILLQFKAYRVNDVYEVIKVGQVLCGEAITGEDVRINSSLSDNFIKTFGGDANGLR